MQSSLEVFGCFDGALERLSLNATMSSFCESSRLNENVWSIEEGTRDQSNGEQNLSDQ